MKKRILCLVTLCCILLSMMQLTAVSVSANSERDTIVSGKFECVWGFYRDASQQRWYISELGNVYQKKDVYSLGKLNPNVSWYEVGVNAAALNSNMTSISVDYSISYNSSTDVYDLGNRKSINFPQIINDRKWIAGDNIKIEWYYFTTNGLDWYIVNDNKVHLLIPGANNEVDWKEIDISGYTPQFRTENGKKYVNFKGTGNTPGYSGQSNTQSSNNTYVNSKPRLVNFSGIPNQIPQGKACYITGQIQSDLRITKVTVSIFSRNDGAASLNVQKMAYPNSYSYDLKEIDKELHFKQYPAGEMELKIFAVTEDGQAHHLTGQKMDDAGMFFSIIGGSNSGERINLNVPLYKQTDSRWKNTKIGTKTIEAVGCTTTAIAMVYSYHSGSTVYPNDMRYKLSYSNNDLNWSSLSSVGLSSKEYMTGVSQSMLSTIYSKLSAGKPVIIGADTTSGKEQHWVVIIGYKGNNLSSFSTSDFIINDPGYQGSETLAEFLANGNEADRTRIKRIIY